MTRCIDKTLAPRNPVARALANRGGSGAHQKGRTSQRQSIRSAVRSELDDWREELEFERSLKSNSSPTNTQKSDDGSQQEPSDQHVIH